MASNLQQTFSQTIKILEQTATALAPAINNVANSIVDSLLHGHKIITCGNGRGASDAQYFASTLSHRYDTERPNLPAVCLSADATTLTAIGCDHDFNQIFARQIYAVGQQSDVLMLFNCNETDNNLIHALHAARQREMKIIAVSHQDSQIMKQLTEQDHALSVPSRNFPAIKQAQLLIMQGLCELIDKTLFQVGE